MDKHYVLERKIEMGNRLREARTRAGLTQAQAAEMIDCSRIHINRVEQGAKELTGTELELLAQAFGVPVMYFFRRLEEYSDAVNFRRSIKPQPT